LPHGQSSIVLVAEPHHPVLALLRYELQQHVALGHRLPEGPHQQFLVIGLRLLLGLLHFLEDHELAVGCLLLLPAFVLLGGLAEVGQFEAFGGVGDEFVEDAALELDVVEVAAWEGRYLLSMAMQMAEMMNLRYLRTEIERRMSPLAASNWS